MYRFILSVLIFAATTALAQTPRIDSDGPIRSTNGGYVFPDGTTQVSAAVSAGPGSVTTAMIADGAITEAKLASSLALGGVNRVVRGIVTFSDRTADVKKSFSPPIDPEKSIVLLSAPVFAGSPGPGSYATSRLGAAVIELEDNSITIAVDMPFSDSWKILPCRVSFQIIEFR